MLADILDSYGKMGVELLKGMVEKVSSSGKTAQSIRYESTEKRLTILGRAAFSSLETGRGPRKTAEYGSFDKGLDEWLTDKGFASKKSASGKKYYLIGSQWFSAKSLAWKINKYGDKLWRQGHGEPVRDVYSNALAKFVEELTEAVKTDLKGQIKVQIKESLNGINSITKA